MRVLVVSQWFPPEPREFLLELAQAYQKAGHEVQVVTGFPNWPGGQVYPGYKVKLIQREVIGGVDTVRLPLYANHSKSGLKRVLNLTSLAISLFFLGPFTLKRAQHIHVIQLPFLVLAAKWLAFWWRATVSMEVQDLWPDTLEASGVSSRKVLGLMGKLCDASYRGSRDIRVISPGFARALEARGVPADKLHLIPNWIDDETNKPLPADTPWDGPTLPQGFRILYAGAIGIPQALSVVLDAAALLKDRPDIVFLIAGDGVEREPLQQRANEEGLDRVVFLGNFPQSEMGKLYAQVDVLLVHLSPDPLFEITIPSKILTYLAYSRPILAGLKGDPAGVIEDTGSGVIFPPGNAQALAAAARTLVDMPEHERVEMGARGRAAAESTYSFRAAIPKLAALAEK